MIWQSRSKALERGEPPVQVLYCTCRLVSLVVSEGELASWEQKQILYRWDTGKVGLERQRVVYEFSEGKSDCGAFPFTQGNVRSHFLKDQHK